MSTPVILATSNGVGMGHLTRQLTLALSAPESLDPIIFSLSGALPTVAAAIADGRLPELADRSVRTEYCPSRLSGWLPARGPLRAARSRYPQYAWEPYLRDRLRALVAETGARAVVFDGVVPYDGLLEARKALPGVAFIWQRRGMWRPGIGASWLARSTDFDLVIEPGDFAGDDGPTADRDDAVHVAPISITSVLGPQDRETAAAALGLDPERKTLLLNPGLGAVGQVETPARVAIAELYRRDPSWQVAVTSPAIAQHTLGLGGDAGGEGAGRADVVLLRDTYPLARSLAAFDAAIGAAGYNSVHELLGSQIPTLLIPSLVGTDDQAARARRLARAGYCLMASNTDPSAIRAGVSRLVDDHERDRLRDACAELPTPDGGLTAAALVADLAGAAPGPSATLADE
ncbi:glycosyltransferase, partial [Kribbia dieselivorans]|uniref:glycosyltransferase n=1 Tax=Kribbia dieselivorans TaxID=331526 RepID=UPI000B1B49E2